MGGSFEDKYYNFVLGTNKNVSKAEAIVFEILDDLRSRRGLKQVFDGIEDDLQETIIQTWIDKTNEILV